MRAWKARVTNGNEYCLQLHHDREFHCFEADDNDPRNSPEWSDFCLKNDIIKKEGHELDKDGVDAVFNMFVKWAADSWAPHKRLSRGGEWLGAARNYIIWNVPNGDHLIFGSNDDVKITMKQIDELASNVAKATVVQFLKETFGRV